VDHAFWHKKWESNQIGFHEAEPHPMLVRHWNDIRVDRGLPVFVPLCGKSNDMLWLNRHGHGVVGVEISKLALSAFFEENALDMTLNECGPFTCHRAPGYRLLRGDYVDLTREILGEIGAVYDRAALIALAPEQRAGYVACLTDLIARGTQILLVTIDHEPGVISPPPFVVDEDEVATLFGKSFSIDRLSTAPALVKGKPCEEAAYRLERT
jgi:thiopurine S-methyltransferase